MPREFLLPFCHRDFPKSERGKNQVRPPNHEHALGDVQQEPTKVPCVYCLPCPRLLALLLFYGEAVNAHLK